MNTKPFIFQGTIDCYSLVKVTADSMVVLETRQKHKEDLWAKMRDLYFEEVKALAEAETGEPFEVPVIEMGEDTWHEENGETYQSNLQAYSCRIQSSKGLLEYKILR